MQTMQSETKVKKEKKKARNDKEGSHIAVKETISLDDAIPGFPYIESRGTCFLS